MMEESIASPPEAHPIMAGTGGIRKARWGCGSRGKSGGVRVLYFYAVVHNAVVMFGIHAKSEKENLSGAERIQIRKALDQIKEAFG